MKKGFGCVRVRALYQYLVNSLTNNWMPAFLLLTDRVDCLNDHCVNLLRSVHLHGSSLLLDS